MVELLAEQNQDRGGVHVLLSNTYTSVDQWDYATKVRNIMEMKDATKETGCS